MTGEKNFIDYYEMFQLDRSKTESQLKKELGKLGHENNQRLNCTDPNNVDEIKQRLFSKNNY